MRRLALPLLLTAALGLAGCATSGGDVEESPSATATTQTVEVGDEGPFPEVGGAFGEKPSLVFSDAEPSGTLQAEVLVPGDGDVVGNGDLLVVDYLGQVWDGDVFDNSYDRGAPAAFSIGTGAVIQGWDAVLVGQQTGSRVIMTIPPEFGYGSTGNSAAGIAGTDTLVFVVDIVDTFAPDVAGSPDAVPTPESASVVPVIEGALGQPASISIPEGAPAPTEGSTTVLATAAGQPAQPGQLVVQYAATYWDNTSGQSTWETGTPAAVDVGTGGAFDSLVGVPVGSRVLLVLPSTAETQAIAVVIDVVAQVSSTVA